MNLLTDPILTVNDGNQVSLPALLAAMAQGQVRDFPALRPHQRPAWHMFLVQLSALALWTAKCKALPTAANDWAAMLRGLTPDHANDEPWTLAVPDWSKPAFMQAPAPNEKLKWKTKSTPDALDMLITSKNHDLKQAVAKRASAEDWVFALVSLQTMEGYGGSGNYGIARMNGGSASRPMLGLAPADHAGSSIHPSRWWARDVQSLIAARMANNQKGVGQVGGPSLLWCLAWPEGEQLDLNDLDPWFIEICRQVRLAETDSSIFAKCSTSKSARVEAKNLQGMAPDPWAPKKKKDGKTLTLSSGNFDYKKLNELLFSGNWMVPLLTKADGNEAGDMLLVAEAFSRGNSKTEGFKSRIVPVPSHAIRLFSSETTAAELAQAQVSEIDAFQGALRFAVALAAANGVQDHMKKSHYDFSKPAAKQLNYAADREFFPSLWRRVAAQTQGEEARSDAKVAFLTILKNEAESALEATLPSVPCPAVYRTRSQIRARRAFWGKLRKSEPVRDLFNREDIRDAA